MPTQTLVGSRWGTAALGGAGAAGGGGAPLRTFVTLLFLFLAISLHAQQARESITVEVVNVPVYVHRGDKPVEGLTRDDFELLVSGKPQAIEYFDVVGGDEPAAPGAAGTAGTAAAAPMRERRLFFFVFDTAFSRPYLIERARNAALQFVNDAKPGDYFAIGTFAPRKGVQILVPFTADAAAVQVAIKGEAATGEDPLHLVVSRGTRTAMMAQVPGEEMVEFPTDASEKSTASQAEGTAPGEPAAPGETLVQTNERLRQLNLEAQRPIIEEQLSVLGELAKRLGTLEGQKHVVLLSEGFDTSSLDGRSGAKMGLSGPYILKLIDDMAKQFLQTGVFLHTLDVSGLTLRGPVRRQEGLQLLASGTGGEFLHDRNDLRAALADVTATFSKGYVLGFRPTGAKSGYNAIRVRVKDRGVKVRHRAGFTGSSPAANPTDALHIADVILNDVPQTGVPARLLMSEGHLQARVPLDQVAAVLGMPGRAELMVYIFDAHGAAIDFKRALLDVPAGAAGVMPIDLVLGLPAGEYTIKALLRAGESLGFSKVKLNVKR